MEFGAWEIPGAAIFVFVIIHLFAGQPMYVSPRALSLFLSILFTVGSSALPLPRSTDTEPVPPPAIVIGFVGGYIRHDNRVHGGVQIADRLRKDYPSGVYIEVFENHRGKQAHQKVLELLGAGHGGSLLDEQKKNARIIIYGHSWGGSETIALARALQKDGVPVLLTIQVDSVSKGGGNQALIPANVQKAANFYQLNGLLHGVREIHASDPSRTQIIGNFQFDYHAHPVRCNGYPWFARLLEKPHIEIECDPDVQSRVETLIRSNLPPPIKQASTK